jgi:hypothetical protein
MTHTTSASTRSAVDPFASRTAHTANQPGLPGQVNPASMFSGTFGPLRPPPKDSGRVVPGGSCAQMYATASTGVTGTSHQACSSTALGVPGGPNAGPASSEPASGGSVEDSLDPAGSGTSASMAAASACADGSLSGEGAAPGLDASGHWLGNSLA